MSGSGNASPQRSPLHDQHAALGAKFGTFGGWSMPLEYAGGGVLSEHRAVRESVGVFDVSHMGALLVTGEDPAGALNNVLTNDLSAVQAGSAQYTLLCDESGGVIDDLIAYRRPREVLLITNAANTNAVVGVLRAALGPKCSVSDSGEAVAILAVQGRKSAEVLKALGMPADMEFLQFRDIKAADGASVTVARTGYTGEVGFEILVPAEAAVGWWEGALAAARANGGLPCGFAARDVLRTEMGYPLHGHEISSEITPVQAGLAWAVAWDKPRFIGRAALTEERREGPRRRLWGLRCEGRGIPRNGMTVATAHGEGIVTSGTFSPVLGAGIALALLPPDAMAGDRAEIDVRGRPCAAEVVKPPLIAADPRGKPCLPR